MNILSNIKNDKIKTFRLSPLGTEITQLLTESSTTSSTFNNLKQQISLYQTLSTRPFLTPITVYKCATQTNTSKINL